MLDLNTYEQFFEYELHIDFKPDYLIQDDYFYYFEIEGGFIGFSFADSNDADNINLLVKKYSPSLKEVDRY